MKFKPEEVYQFVLLIGLLAIVFVKMVFPSAEPEPTIVGSLVTLAVGLPIAGAITKRTRK